MFFNDTLKKPQKVLGKTQDTLWPSHTPHHIKVWTDEFFQLLDGYSPEAAQQWAELYTSNGVFEAFGQTFKGLEAIKAHIHRFWALFPGLVHTPKSVYISRGTHAGSEMDIVAITNYAISFPNGQFVTGESVALLNIVQEGNRLAIRSNRLYLDPNTLMQALEAQSLKGGQKEVNSTHHENVAEETSLHVEKAS
ncbi:hypothetical protein BDV38DRAFT_236528 [Aspergillus pseudotamarii]|uniref:SnoaL-like domain-containing protein n=1 Tax=Aspergillus pseudotamarii TaxID=132259 RepID=A0A5N6T692_ASPPS|nr:uncharacterized protein BDV38DRAFT_236528 [Aspergillus pseudotamarii]KAE8141838.1 hypothetical protein BDV38DRAFT_236528 [Aspergillus pseudotamarii]